MAGTITCGTLSDGTNSTSSTNCIQGSAKAWANYNGSTPALLGTYNIGSVTKNGTGNYTFNMTNAMPDANYAVVAASGAQNGSGTGEILVSTFTTNSFLVRCFNSSGTTAFDFWPISVAVHR